MIWHYDCRHFLGTKPCRYRRVCEGCADYAPVGRRILIIKLAAVGDVLRTTPLLRGLLGAYPDAEITWLTDADAAPLLQGIPEIHRLLVVGWEAVVGLRHEVFDQLYCLDKEPRATALAMEIPAKSRAGFGLSRLGKPMPLSPSSEYLFELGVHDELKFRRNRKTYPELIFECAGLSYREPQEYLLPDLRQEIAAGRELLGNLGVAREDLKIGLNTGASEAFASKKWTEDGFARLADLLSENLAARVLLLGGPAETERNERIAHAARHAPLNPGTGFSLRSFAGILGNLDLLVTGDTLAMHIAIGLKVPVLVLFGATCHQEIELYGRGAKIVSSYDCSPCYLSTCPKDQNCMQAITAEAVFEAASRLLRKD